MIKKYLYNICRKKLLKKVTGNLGKVEIKDRKIICYVENKKVKKHRLKFSSIYSLSLKGTSILNKVLLNKYDIKYPVCYIFDNIIFDDYLKIVSNFENTIIFRNCIFVNEIYLYGAREVIFNSNKYFNEINGYVYGKDFLTFYGDSIKFVDEKFVNSNVIKNYKLNMNIYSSNFIIDNSIISVGKNGKIFAKTENVYINNSTIDSQEILLITNNIENENSDINASKEFAISTKKSKGVANVTSPCIIYNGIDMASKNNSVVNIDNSLIDIYESRRELINKLAQIRDCCIKINSIKLNNMKEKLEKQNILKLIKNK